METEERSLNFIEQIVEKRLVARCALPCCLIAAHEAVGLHLERHWHDGCGIGGDGVAVSVGGERLLPDYAYWKHNSGKRNENKAN